MKLLKNVMKEKRSELIMSEEIKEILDRMQELVEHKYDKEIHTYNLFDDIQDLLNYITNLQQKVEQLENIRKEAIDFIKEHARIDDEYPSYIEMLLEEKQDLLNILSKGSE